MMRSLHAGRRFFVLLRRLLGPGLGGGGTPRRSEMSCSPTAAAWVLFAGCALVLTSCGATEVHDPDPGGDDAHTSVRSLAQAFTDTDDDGMDDDWETQHFGDLSQTGTGDFDADGMTNGEEFLHGFDPTVSDALVLKLRQAVAAAAARLTPQDARGWFAHCGVQPE
jgi:hypothetical protein